MKRILVFIKGFLFLFIAFSCSLGVVFADTHYVSVGSDVQGVINSASSGDTVIFRDGTYYLSSSLVVDEALTLRAFNPGGAHLVATFPYTTNPNGNRAVVKIRSNGVTVSGLDINSNNRRHMGLMLILLHL